MSTEHLSGSARTDQQATFYQPALGEQVALGNVTGTYQDLPREMTCKARRISHLWLRRTPFFNTWEFRDSYRELNTAARCGNYLGRDLPVSVRAGSCAANIMEAA